MITDEQLQKWERRFWEENEVLQTLIAEVRRLRKVIQTIASSDCREALQIATEETLKEGPTP